MVVLVEVIVEEVFADVDAMRLLALVAFVVRIFRAGGMLQSYGIEAIRACHVTLSLARFPPVLGIFGGLVFVHLSLVNFSASRL